MMGAETGVMRVEDGKRATGRGKQVALEASERHRLRHSETGFRFLISKTVGE